ncbi:MAG: serine hydroxymethyltransferase [Methylocystis sp.]|uniref:serine hydroxymethyltransferase n=1 Tax=Phenylobacterium sp. TaxID=1871053 RepID=UPI0025CF8C0C|nr:serine hydroxymethyltransferase [Phenylobacterium sp.]MCA3585168.1 serine hydroxymethyltransferase [Methylocystis sp.]MCA6286271.1 serine hydroxymethyltransferase [Phenylobacterium sp.]MCA6289917.1 serine hydroxymethyltransferase [Phenylobacterium sp.]MCA6346653.1 serine hydroxymethyltransferase [Phenylobacterium sp.]MCA6349249.1 serine hydroxymethyltransferase [Phenylobacterium sp.]
MRGEETAIEPQRPGGGELALGAWRELQSEDTELARLLEAETNRQRTTLSLVASSSVTRPSVLACEGAVFGNLTAEGYPGLRFHGGCVNADRLETLAIERACTVFRAAYANVQPLSASIANQIVFASLMAPGDTMLGLSLKAGGHLSHGARGNLSGRNFRARSYGLSPNGEIDYDGLISLAQRVRPRLIVAGTTAYPRQLDFQRFRAIADDVGAWLVADITHIAGLVAAGEHPSPVDAAHVVTTCTHKQMFGPRGGLILVGRSGAQSAIDGEPLTERLQKGVFPMMQGAPNLNMIAAKARALGYASTPAFRSDMRRVRALASHISATLQTLGMQLVSGGTDTHIVLLDVRGSLGLSGKAAQDTLESCGVVVNKNLLPGDPLPASLTSGVRIGSNSIAARRMDAAGAEACARLVWEILAETAAETGLSPGSIERFRRRAADLCRCYPLAYDL